MRILSLSLASANEHPEVHAEAMAELEKVSELQFVSILDQLDAEVENKKDTSCMEKYMEYLFLKGKFDTARTMYEVLFHKKYA